MMDRRIKRTVRRKGNFIEEFEGKFLKTVKNMRGNKRAVFVAFSFTGNSVSVRFQKRPFKERTIKSNRIEAVARKLARLGHKNVRILD